MAAEFGVYMVKTLTVYPSWFYLPIVEPLSHSSSIKETMKMGRVNVEGNASITKLCFEEQQMRLLLVVFYTWQYSLSQLVIQGIVLRSKPLILDASGQ